MIFDYNTYIYIYTYVYKNSIIMYKKKNITTLHTQSTGTKYSFQLAAL